MTNKHRNQWYWGFTNSAENWNGRISMISFLVILIIEIVSRQNILTILKIT
uniref:CAB/ELIP/HLIP superfamily protein n=1 Tax=Compsopogon caeruleus TaxID=31354 RepID=A0A1Z1XB14_9RHOD|nr:hypothetical protein [Compsopogon caeruleus]ARX96006.1 hypothetical protein [Compsopogon caeruleus]